MIQLGKLYNSALQPLLTYYFCTKSANCHFFLVIIPSLKKMDKNMPPAK